MTTVYEQLPVSEKVFHDLWMLTSVSPLHTAEIMLGREGKMIEVEVDYQGDLVTAYMLDADGDALAENEISTVPFDSDLNLDIQAERALESVAEDIVRFWKDGS